jgi:UDP-N-acetylmuramoylalanine--D-glutamate ligase
MTPVTCFSGKTVTVFGLGGSGLVTAEALRAGGARVFAWDDKEAARAKAAEAGFAIADPLQQGLDGQDALILSPGVPLTHPAPHPVVLKAQEARVEIIGDIELFFRQRALIAPDAPCVAITGTNGKSTTTALIAHLLEVAGRDVATGGNIGTAILALPPPDKTRVHVIECSSFQIDLAPSLAASIGILTNLTPDHLDRHGSMALYAAIKQRLVDKSGLAVIGVDDVFCQDIADQLEGQDHPLVRLSMDHALQDGISRDATRLVLNGPDGPTVLADLAGIPSLRGVHNAQNAAAAIVAVRALGVDAETIRRGLRSFPGLAHRMQPLGHVGRALIVNDSKATNAEAAEKALASFAGGIHWIIGGVAKEGGIAGLKPYFNRIAHAYLIGKSTPVFAAQLGDDVPFSDCGTLEQAFAQAVARANARANASSESEPVVLLSPACASYDQFPNFEVRGARFKDMAEAMTGFRQMEKDA